MISADFSLPLRGFVIPCTLGKFDSYKIALKSLAKGDHTFDFLLDSEYFKKIDSQEVQSGKVAAKVLVKNNGRSFELIFSLEGTIKVPCDRCLDDMDLPIQHNSRLIVKFGEAYAEEGDEIIIVPESEGEINVAWFLYEFVVLSIPMKHIHAPGKCNRLMSGKLKQHLTKSDVAGDEDIEMDFENEVIDFDDNESSTDPRWDELKKIIDNN